MDARKFLQNQIILNNCKEYLELLSFLPYHEDICNIINNYNPESIIANQEFKSTENTTKIKFEILKSTDRVSAVEKKSNSLFDLEVELIHDKISTISYSISPNINRTVRFMNNRVCKVIDFFTNYPSKKQISYYLDKQLIHVTLTECVFNHHYWVLKTSFVDMPMTLNGSFYHDVRYERDYRKDMCYLSTYPYEEKENISHSQFEKRSKGVLKRLAQVTEKK